MECRRSNDIFCLSSLNFHLQSIWDLSMPNFLSLTNTLQLNSNQFFFFKNSHSSPLFYTRIATPNRLFIIFFSSSHNDTDTCTTVNTPSTTERSWPPAHRWWWSNVVHSMHAAEAKNNNKIVSGEKKGKTKARLENSPQSASTLTH